MGWVTPQQMADAAGVSRQAIDKALQTGRISAASVRQQGRWRVIDQERALAELTGQPFERSEPLPEPAPGSLGPGPKLKGRKRGQPRADQSPDARQELEDQGGGIEALLSWGSAPAEPLGGETVVQPPPVDERPLANSVAVQSQRQLQASPEYAVSRAKVEKEKAKLLEIKRRKAEGELVERAAVERAQSDLAAIVRTKLLGVPSRAKQRIPHLTVQEVEELTLLIREALEEVAGGR
jgi:hypothetical protein